MRTFVFFVTKKRKKKNLRKISLQIRNNEIRISELEQIGFPSCLQLISQLIIIR